MQGKGTPKSLPQPRDKVASPIPTEDTLDEEDDHDITDYNPEAQDPLSRNFTQQDASLLVGGEEFHPDVEEQQDKLEEQLGNGKVFLFSLPFGGLLSIRPKFKFPLGGSKEDDSELEEIRLKLERQQLILTMEEAKVFSKVKGLDDVRLRAVKKSIKENISEFLPDFIHEKKEKYYDAIYHTIDGPIVVMGGYRGLILRDAESRKRVWIPLKAGFNLRKINLLLGPSPLDELKATDLIYPDGVLKNIGPIDICKKLIKKLDANPKTSVYEFGYDWRLSLDITSNHLAKYLKKIRVRTGKKPIVIAHSMGGLVAHGALQKDPDLFRGIVYVGSPLECLNILGPIRYGDSILFSDRILTFETNFMMRSSFVFLPTSGRVFVNKHTGEWYDLDFFDPETWVKYNLNPLVSEHRLMRDAQAAQEGVGSIDGEVSNSLSNTLTPPPNSPPNSPNLHHGHDSSPTISALSSVIKLPRSRSISRKNKPPTLTNSQMQKLHAKSGSTSPVSARSPTSNAFLDYVFSFSFAEAYEYLKDTLKTTKAYVDSLWYREDLKSKYPPLAMVYGNTVPSVRASGVNGIQDIKDGNYYDFLYGRGDGVVHQRWLMPEQKGFEIYNPDTHTGHIVGKFESSAGHVDLMTDHKAMGKALHAIVEAEKHWY